MTRFRLADVVELGGGWARLPEPGEELYRITVSGCPYRSWLTEEQLADLTLYGMPCLVESKVVPGLAPAPDPRQLELNITPTQGA